MASVTVSDLTQTLCCPATANGFRLLETTRMCWAKEIFGWEQNSGIFVPILASFEHNRPELPLAMEGLPREELAKQIRIFKTKTNVQLHWISINQEIDPKLTSLSMLDSVSDFFQLTDPLEQGLPVLDTFQTPGDVSEK
ncbi:hypothetical protein [Rhodopirellula islandica]|nr:hypothetical protein [Rhodopirellula islandica]